ncbi:MAG: flagellar hook protein FlgE [Gemmatimonadaceae bacterium]|nr:flagellar hook protein FlgE [Acetobacteraceae bacterium]
MSLFGAMNTAISGLIAQSAAFGNIGDNVANSQTVGFKRIDTTFQDYLTTSSATNNQSGSVVARPDYVNTVQGTVTQTDKPLDLAITGQGFFSVSRQIGEAGGAPVFRNQVEYTRAGNFGLNREGFLVNSSNHFLNGWSADAAGVVQTTSLAPIRVGQSGFSPVPTSQVVLAANLPATPAPGAPVASQVQVYDALGQTHPLQLSWTPVAGTPNSWEVAITVPGAAAPVGVAAIAFGSAGNQAAPEGTIGSVTSVSGTTTGSTFAAGTSATLGFVADFGSGPQPITLNLGTFGQPNGLTQFAGTDYRLQSLTQNGVAPGSFSGVETKPNGDVVVNFDNGQSRIIARVPLTTFADPDALQREDGQAFTATRESGAPQTLAVGSNGAGDLVVSAVESSNVDIAREFTKLIVAQRAYSANTKLVTTADELLQQTLDMKR